jgi:hypothetical protein
LGFSKKWENVNFQSLILYVSFLEPQTQISDPKSQGLNSYVFRWNYC